MKKSDIVDAMAKKTHMTKKDMEAALTAFLETVEEALKDGEKVTITGFGTFEVRERAERLGRNPRTKETMMIPPSKTPAFKPGKGLKEKINE